MQKFFSYSPFDHDVEKATSEMNTSEDWETILKICDNVNEKPSAAKDCLRAILKRLNSNVPHHAMSALTLLDSCIKNCGRSFHLEVCSRDFEVEIKKIMNKAHPKVIEKLKDLMKKWSEDFKNDPQLSLIPSLYHQIKNEKVDIATLSDTISSAKLQMQRKEPSSMTTKEEEDLAKAIELSLKEPGSSPKGSSSLYPVAQAISNSSTLSKPKEPRKVRALYDFEADEYEDELSLKAGEIVLVLDDTDSNWWKGESHGRQGLFPANFVTSDLTYEPEPPVKVEKKAHSVKFNGEVKVKTLEEQEEVYIDEEKINQLLHLLNEADPSGERPDPEELLAVEEQCLSMGCLIDQELEKIDRHHASLTASNTQLVDALNSYQALMKDYTSVTYSPYSHPEMMHHYQSLPQQQSLPQMYSGSVPSNYMSSETYQSVPLPPSTEQYSGSVPPSAGPLPTMLPPNMMQPGGPIPYGNTNPTSYSNVSIPPNSMPVSSATYGTSHLSRDQNGVFYGDMVVNSMPPSSTALRQQPML
ncbi:signal transducing adapter molecule 1-like [Uloborus diversus]|uniref:signal transducing adapter molecule 1-like n=1 Tax=Uloborus diversus TaxID=327109 RepID=UPI002409E25E|nr:signal transducing adapter molecule 1-like [Uloborus diversus]